MNKAQEVRFLSWIVAFADKGSRIGVGGIRAVNKLADDFIGH